MSKTGESAGSCSRNECVGGVRCGAAGGTVEAFVLPDGFEMWVGRKGDTNFCELAGPERFNRRLGSFRRRLGWVDSQSSPNSLVCDGLRCWKRLLRRYNTSPTTTKARKRIAPVTDPITAPSTFVPAPPRAVPGVPDGENEDERGFDEGLLVIVGPAVVVCDGAVEGVSEGLLEGKVTEVVSVVTIDDSVDLVETMVVVLVEVEVDVAGEVNGAVVVEVVAVGVEIGGGGSGEGDVNNLNIEQYAPSINLLEVVVTPDPVVPI